MMIELFDSQLLIIFQTHIIIIITVIIFLINVYKPSPLGD